MLAFLQKLASYFYPILIKRIPSKVSGDIEISMQNGKLVLDSKHANYSYGSLHSLFQKVIKDFTFPTNRKKVLILGFGGGSIAEILNVEQQLNLQITAIDLDRVVIEAYQKYFKKEAHQCTLIQGDAMMFLQNCRDKFDYIFIDVFSNLDVPEKFKTSNFLHLLDKISLPHTQIAMNTILEEEAPFIHLWKKHYAKSLKIRRLTRLNLVLYSLPENYSAKV